MNISFHFNLQFESLSIHTHSSQLFTCLRTHVPFESSDYFHRLCRKANADKLTVLKTKE